MPKPVSQYLPAWKMEKTKSIPNNEFLHQGDVQWQHKKNRQQKLSGSRKAALIIPVMWTPFERAFSQSRGYKRRIRGWITMRWWLTFLIYRNFSWVSKMSNFSCKLHLLIQVRINNPVMLAERWKLEFFECLNVATVGDAAVVKRVFLRERSFQFLRVFFSINSRKVTRVK